MKRGLVLLIIISLVAVTLSASIISAGYSYSCSAGKPIIVTDAIKTGETEHINGLNIGLAASSFNSADILIDAKQITLTNGSSIMSSNLLSENFNVSLVNISGNTASLQVKSSTGTAKVNNVKEIGGYQIYILSLSGVYPGEDAYVNLIVGKYYQFFSSKQLTTKKTINEKEYIVELLSASSMSAGINVIKCDNGTLTMTNDTVLPIPPINTTPRTNTTANNTQNTTQDNSSSDDQNETSNESTTDSGTLEGVKKTMRERLMTTPFIVMFILFGITLLIIIAMYIKSKVSGVKNETPAPN